MILYIHDQLAAEPSTHERLKKQKAICPYINIIRVSLYGIKENAIISSSQDGYKHRIACIQLK